ncbi:MAG TPA: hypothetical protein VG820_09350, partial [Fimbriimonadaceae bacterium]|nr:hypothetical protein [Fimbriimonadaceae bacterium]
MLRARTLILFLSALAVFGFAQTASKKPLDAATYDTWKSLRNLALSNNGKWVLYTLALQDGDATVEIKATDGSKSYTLERAGPVSFSENSRFVVATITPKTEDVKKARRAKTKPEDMPKNGLTILNLETGQRFDAERISSFNLAPHDCGWLLYKPEPPKPEPPKPAPKQEAPKPEANKPEEKKPEEKKPGVKPDHKAGDLYILRNLETGKEEKLENVTAARWSKDGATVAYAVSTADGAGDGVVVEDVKSGAKKSAVIGVGKYSKLAICDTTKDVAFTTDKDDYQAKKPAISVYVYRAIDGHLSKVDPSTLLAGFVPSESGSLQFSEKGTRLVFGVGPKPVEEKKDDTPDDEKVSVDVWNWQDPQMMPQQLLQAASERNRTYDAIYDLSTGAVVQLENSHLRNVTIGAKGDGDTALGSSNEPYLKESSWGDGRIDYDTVDLLSGKPTPILKAFSGSINLSPTGRYAYGYDQQARDFLCIDLHTGKRVSLSKAIPVPIYDEENDVPSDPDAYGVAGWTPNDAGLLIYDRYDVWLVDPMGASKPANLTAGIGRASSTVLRLERLDRDEDFIDLSKPVLLGAFNDHNKQAGFYKLTKGQMTKLFMVDKGFGPGPALTPTPAVVKARDAEEYAYQQMDFNVYADAWLADADLKNPRKISDANPQQKDYNWCTSE